MPDGIRLEGSDDLTRLAAAYRGGDKVIRKNISKALRDVGKPIAKDVLQEAAAGLPRKGGLSARVAAGPVTIAQTLGGNTVGVSLSLRGKGIKNLRAMDNGTVRHPVFGRSSSWRSQPVTPHLFTDAFGRQKAKATEAMSKAIQKAADEIAKEA